MVGIRVGVGIWVGKSYGPGVWLELEFGLRKLRLGLELGLGFGMELGLGRFGVGIRVWNPHSTQLWLGLDLKRVEVGIRVGESWSLGWNQGWGP